MVWSVSLDRTWSRCQRQYFFQYKMADAKAKDEARKRAQLLKDVLSPELWQGRLVHKVIETVILPKLQGRNRQWLPPEVVISQAIELVESQFAFSRDKIYQSVSKKKAGKNYCILAPHYFENADDEELLDKTIDVVSGALQNLLASEQMKTFLIGRIQYRIEKSHYLEVGDATIKAVPDLIMPNKKRGGIDIIDWKVTTTSDPYDFQVAVYSLAVKNTDWLFRIAPGEIYAYVINLLEPDPGIALIDPYKVSNDILARTLDVIYEKIERIESLVKGRKFTELNIDDFMFARSIGTCALCNWKSMCVEMSNGSPAKFLPDTQPKPTQPTLPFF